MKFRNPKFNKENGIECEVKHPNFGWVQFTANKNDPDANGKRIYSEALKKAMPYSENLLEKNIALSQEIRIKRNVLLSDCDWTQLPDANVNADLWKAYRNKLKLIPDQKDFPHAIVWPNIPD